MKSKSRISHFKSNIKSKGYTILLAILASVTLIACQQTDAVQEKMNLATEYMSEGNYEQAIVMYREVLDTEPENVEAYLGIADAYEAMEDYETGLAVLEEAYEVTGEETLVQEIQEVEELHVAQQEALQAEAEKEEEKEAWELGPNPIGGNLDSFDMEPAVPVCEINGIKHPAYYEFEFTDEQKAYLDNLIELTESGQYGQAIAALDSEMIIEMSNIEGNSDGSDYGCYWINCVYKDRKIHLAYLPYTIKIIIIPMNDGTGYAVATGEHKTNAYLTGNCSGGFFNGEFTACATEIFAEGTENQKITGNMVNGMLDGEISEYVQATDTTFVRSYNQGKQIYSNLVQDGANTSYLEGYYIFNGEKYDLISGGINDTVEQTRNYLEWSLFTVDHVISNGLHSVSSSGTGTCDW